MSEERECNGWANKETWLVMAHYRELLFDQCAEGEDDLRGFLEGALTVDEYLAGFERDMLICAMGRVDWDAIGRQIRDDVALDRCNSGLHNWRNECSGLIDVCSWCGEARA